MSRQARSHVYKSVQICGGTNGQDFDGCCLLHKRDWYKISHNFRTMTQENIHLYQFWVIRANQKSQTMIRWKIWKLQRQQHFARQSRAYSPGARPGSSVAQDFFAQWQVPQFQRYLRSIIIYYNIVHYLFDIYICIDIRLQPSHVKSTGEDAQPNTIN